MLLRITTKLWRKYLIAHKQRVEEHSKRGQQNYNSSIEDMSSPSGETIKGSEKLEVIPQREHRRLSCQPGSILPQELPQEPNNEQKPKVSTKKNSQAILFAEVQKAAATKED